MKTTVFFSRRPQRIKQNECKQNEGLAPGPIPPLPSLPSPRGPYSRIQIDSSGSTVRQWWISRRPIASGWKIRPLVSCMLANVDPSPVMGCLRSFRNVRPPLDQYHRSIGGIPTAFPIRYRAGVQLRGGGNLGAHLPARVVGTHKSVFFPKRIFPSILGTHLLICNPELFYNRVFSTASTELPLR